MRNLVTLLLLVLVLASCQSLQRLGRVSPLAGEVAEDRINLWPLYYQNGSEVAVLWPIYDLDEEGFALRPLVTHDGDDWEVLPPVAWWDTDTGNWIVVPAYSIEDNWGLFPVLGIGEFSFVGPAWWTDEAGGLFPLVTIGDELNWVGPAWWLKDDAGDVTTSGLFPLYTAGETFNNVGPVFWGEGESGPYFTVFPIYGHGQIGGGGELTWAGPAWWHDDESGELNSWGLFPLVTNINEFYQLGPVFWEENNAGDLAYLVALPLFGFSNRDDGSGMMLSLLGGKGWDAEGETAWLNVLGPVYHHSRDGDDRSTHLLWPFVHWAEGETESDWYLWPLVGSETQAASEDHAGRTRTWGLAGLIEGSGSDASGLDSLRVAPLFSHLSADAGAGGLLDWLTLYGSQAYGDGARSMHVGTPLVFNHYRDGDVVRWSALLDVLDYETDGTDSSFELLWYLYRQRTTGSDTRRDFFPFVSWDSGADSTEFSFLWRLLHYESQGDRSGGHFLFFPWGDTD